MRTLFGWSVSGVVLLTLALVIPAHATDETTPASRPAPKSLDKQKGVADLSDRLAPIIRTHDIPGMVVAVLRDGKVVATGAAGLRMRGGEEGVTVGDDFHIGSCTKSMTATLIAILVEEKVLKWEMTLKEAFPEMAMHGGYEGVTLDALLCNHGGCPGDIAPPLWKYCWEHQEDPVAVRRHFTREILSLPPAQKPGVEYAYSNAGFTIAGHVAESKTKKPFEQLMQEKLFAPLGMSSAGFGAPGEGHPLGHQTDGTKVERGVGADNPVAISPAGRVHLSIRDWGKYIQFHLDKGAKPKGLLSARAFDRLQRRFREDHPYARGWLRVPRGWAKKPGSDTGGDALTHNGSNTYWFAVTWLAPDRNFAVLVACNQGGDRAATACDIAAALGVGFLEE